MDPESDVAPVESGRSQEPPAGTRGRARWVRRLVAVLAGLALIVTLLGPAILAAIGRWLARPDPLPSEAGVLVVISGDPYGLREEEAARLWREGLAPVILVSGGSIAWETVAAEVMRRHLLRLGLPPEAVRVEPQASSTAENAAFTLPMVEDLGARTVVVVTSNYHVRRTRMTFRRAYGPGGIRVFVHGAPDPGFHPDRWWREGSGREYALLELAKILWYGLHLK
ncbi:YdcF family protein [Limnochorda pilosa]|uniref:DUF218 domain-containing protein n=1 Tax=Limnochorda pilosa TaxID=1555112 RepID=A0A0K2SR55_LIMPI|nr:YdcF family protein [Limnochorda pilosa]BAS29304.1 hypothetical protein LIP_3492 [Limnochorda pilosa]